MAAALGASALGVVIFPPSPRAVTPEQVPDIFAGVEAGVERIALFVNPDAELVNRVLEAGAIDCLQFHGEEDEDFCASFGLPYMKAIRVRTVAQALQEMSEHPSAERYLLDKYVEQVPGGTGQTFDWSMAKDIVAASDKPVVLAGGLNSENIAAAIQSVQPAGVDVSSGVEQAPGIKCVEEMKLFIEGVRSV